MNKGFVLGILLLISGCTTLEDLKVPAKKQYFVLAQDYVRTEVRGLLNNRKWVEGLRSGTYIAEREDDEGIFLWEMGLALFSLLMTTAKIT